MKKCVIKSIFLLTAVLFAFIFISCSNQIGSTLVDDDLSGSVSPGVVYDDPTRGVAVYVDASGVETIIRSEEESGLITCVEVIDSAFSGGLESSNRSAGSGADFWQAIVLGKRNDGSFGLWMVYSGGRVTSVIISDDLEGSDLQDLIAARRPRSKYFGWSYENLKIVVNGDEFIIIGTAKSESEIGWHNYTLAADTSIGVYWAGKVIKEYDEMVHFYISRAKVIGIKDRSWWQDYKQTSGKSDYSHGHRWMWALRMFFSGWYDKYLTEPESIVLEDETLGEYRVDGIDQDGDDAFAIITARKVLSVEKDPGSGDNRPPYAVSGPTTATLKANRTYDQFVTLETDAPGLELDPDGDDAYFYSDEDLSFIELDKEKGILIINAADEGTIDITVWIEDEHGLASKAFPITLIFLGEGSS